MNPKKKPISLMYINFDCSLIAYLTLDGTLDGITNTNYRSIIKSKFKHIINIEKISLLEDMYFLWLYY